MKSRIALERMRFQAFHGVLPQERAQGNTFLVDVEMHADIDKAILSDALEDTLDYSLAYGIVKEQMEIPSQLLEHVAGRILFALFDAFSILGQATVRVRKENPPLGGDVAASLAEITLSRTEWITLKGL